ncbi:hypothetical protein RUM44_001367 [Polyplax serrata]|uniref:Uncharacterized protein n=1 Tax=Polyplax serrata TaxID=468196 RepID=A0ABR1AJW5_POLSC
MITNTENRDTNPVETATSSIETFFSLLNRDQRTILTIDRNGERYRRETRNSGKFARNDVNPVESHELDVANSISVIGRLIRKIRSKTSGRRRSGRFSYHHLTGKSSQGRACLCELKGGSVWRQNTRELEE